MHLERGLQSSRKREKLGRLPFPRGIPVRVESNGMKRDDQHPADQGGAVIHFPVRVWRGKGYGKLFRHPTAVRRGVSGFRVAQHLHLSVAHDKQAETAGRERYDALIGERTERFRDDLNRHRIVLRSAADELDVAVDCDDASGPTQRDGVLRVRRFPLLGYGKLFHRPAAADTEIVSAVHAAADRDLAARVE